MKGGSVWTYPFNKDDPKVPQRSHEGMRSDALKGLNEKKPVNGVKHPTWLHRLKHFDSVNGVAVDYVHGVLLGVTKLLTRLWFSKEFTGQHFNIQHFLPQADKRIEEIKPPIEITRVPRSFSKYSSDWKGSEFRTLLLFYGVPILFDLLPPDLLQHFS